MAGNEPEFEPEVERASTRQSHSAQSSWRRRLLQQSWIPCRTLLEKYSREDFHRSRILPRNYPYRPHSCVSSDEFVTSRPIARNCRSAAWWPSGRGERTQSSTTTM